MTPPVCAECRHCVTFRLMGGEAVRQCERTTPHHFDVVNGATAGTPNLCRTERSRTLETLARWFGWQQPCGPSGRHFEARQPATPPVGGSGVCPPGHGRLAAVLEASRALVKEMTGDSDRPPVSDAWNRLRLALLHYDATGARPEPSPPGQRAGRPTR